MAEIGNSRRRVKLYMLNEERQWDDRGTGYVTYAYIEKLKGMSLLVRLETDGSLLLESKILPDTAYQKQQETLIVWSEAENYDLALSFQEKSGCDEIWEKICQVQGKDPSVDVTQEVPEDPESSTGEDPINVSGDDLPDEPAIELPPCEMSRLDEIADVMTTCFPLPIRRERLATAIENENYIKKLMDLFHMCEDLDNIDGLHNLYDIFKNIFLLNKAALYDILLCDDVIMDIVGVFEYDPHQTKRVKHRDYLRDASRFKEVVAFTNPDLIQKIHQTYRVQYIQDVILPTPSVFEENMLSCLNSFIFFNKVEIVTAIQEDDNFLKKLFEQLVSDDTDRVRRRQLVLFLKEFCTFSQTLQIQPREAFFKTLSNLEILPALKVIFGVDDEVMKAAAIDIFSFIIEYSPSMVRGFILHEGAIQDDDEELLINLVVDQMVSDKDPELGGAVQLMGILRLLIDPENMVAANNANKTEKTEFLSFFYKHSMHALTAPLFAITANDQPSKDDFQSAQLLSLILELLTFCVEHHAYHMKNYILNKDLLRRVLVLMKSSHAFLTLCGLRFMRRILSLKDEFYNRYIVKGNLFLPVVRAFVDNGPKYNLLNSAIIEMFEFIKSEDIKTLCSHVVDEYFTAFETVDYVKTFKDLKLRHDQQLDRLQSDRTPYETITVTPLLRNNRFRRDPRTLDDEEEIWFDQDDDVDSEDAQLPLPPNDVIKAGDLVDCSPDHDPITKFMGSTKRVREPTTDLRESPPKLIARNSSPISINLKTSPTSNTPQTPPSGGNSPKTIGPSNQNGALNRLTKDSDPLAGLNKPLKGLVDYPDEDSDEEQENNAPADAISPPAAKRPRLSC